jgi:hypothetical protein
MLVAMGLAGVLGCMPTDGGNNGGNDGGGDNGGNNGGDMNTNGGDGGDGGDMNTNGGDDNGDDIDNSMLFVVNNDGPSVTFYTGVESLDGELVPGGEVEAGAATSLFQPRSVVVTNSGRLLVSRQNGGIVGYNDSTTLDENTTADLVVDGNDTGLETPIAMAYDADEDRLFVGNVNAQDGILVFDNVSNAAFDEEVAPNRTFGPPDRAPFDPTVFTVDAMHIAPNGDLFVSEAQGDITVNRNRILVFTNPGVADGETPFSQRINSNDWEKHEDIFVDDAGVLYIVDATDSIKMVGNVSSIIDETVVPDTLTVNIALADLQGIAVTKSGTGLVADRGNSAIYSYLNIAGRNGLLGPDRTLDGFETQLRGPRQLWVVEDDSQN